MIEKVDARPPEEQIVTAQFRIRGTRHLQELRDFTQVGAAGEITLAVLRPQVIACLNETLGEERLSTARDVRFPDGQHIEDIPVLTPSQFKMICESLGLGEIAEQVEEMRLSGSCKEVCGTSYNPDPWNKGRRKRRLEKSVGGKQTIGPDGKITNSVSYGEAPQKESVIIKARNPETGLFEIVAVVEREIPSSPPRVPKHQRPKPQPTEKEAQASLARDGVLTEESMPF